MSSIVMLVALTSLCSSCHSLHCRHSEDGRHYDGVVNVSLSGTLCQPWNMTKHKYTLQQLRIKSFEENVCRNPNGSASPWCIVGDVRTEKCNIPKCVANPGANYCIIIPKIHFKFCPQLFIEKILFKEFTKIIFCCLYNVSKVLELLPKDTCLLVIIGDIFVKEHFAVCPEGFDNKQIPENLVESNVVYKCCKTKNPSRKVIDIVKNFTVATGGSNDVAPIFAAVSLKHTLCPALGGFTFGTVEYHGMGGLSGGVLPSRITLCLYYLRDASSILLNYSKLGLMTLGDCPGGFIESNESHVFDQSLVMKSCWPTQLSSIHSNGRVCLNFKSTINDTLLCPQDFQSYDLQSAFVITESPRFCCRFQDPQIKLLGDIVNMTDNTSLAFITTSERCPIYYSSDSVEGFLVKVSLRWPTSSNDTFGYKISAPTLDSESASFCIYEKDKFAYKKVGATCPERTLATKMVFKDTSFSANEFTMEFCVGNGLFKYESFPAGQYCLYKVGRGCPFGFVTQSLGRNLSIVTKRNSVTGHHGAFQCCRNDSATNNISFPFIHPNRTVAFGLLRPSHYDVCPHVHRFINNMDVDAGVPYCAFRSLDGRKDYEPSKGDTMGLFIKPTFSVCPKSYREINITVALDRDDKVDPLTQHFLVDDKLFLCVPIKDEMTNQNPDLPASLCLVSLLRCSPEEHAFNLTSGEDKNHLRAYACCSQQKSIYSTNKSLPPQFSLPLKRDEKRCPPISTHLSSIWRMPVSGLKNWRYLQLCFYYEPPPLKSWPSGRYLTVAEGKLCPLDFEPAVYNDSNLCVRTDTMPSFSQLPEGNYCVLSLFNETCPTFETLHSRTDLITLGRNIFNLCCSISTAVILNIPRSPETVFAFLALGICSIIPGTHVTRSSFLSLKTIVRCVFRRDECKESDDPNCLTTSDIKESKVNIDISILNRQNIIIALLVSLLAALTLFGIALVLQARCKLVKLRSSKVSNIRLSAIYTQIDISTNYTGEEYLEEDTPSVAYSIIS